MSKVAIYTDGGCFPNPGPGAWAFYVDNGRLSFGQSGFAPETTNNRMEISGVLEALEWCQQNGVHTPAIYTDSQYVQKGCTQWLAGWKVRGWRNYQNKPVMNRDLWERMDALLKVVKPRVQWIKGHSGHPLNDQVDAMCTEAMRRKEGQHLPAFGAVNVRQP